MSKPKTKTKPRALRFDIETLREMVGEKVFARGVDYYEDKKVEILAVEDGRVLARVAGSENYRVALQGAGRGISGECSCPAFSDHGFCKHMVATALAANAMEPGEAKEAGNRFARIRDHLRAQGVDALVTRIMDLAERDPALFEELEFAAELNDADDKALTALIRKAITDATRTRGFVEYREARDWAKGVERVLDRVAHLALYGKAEMALAALDHFFDRMEKALNEIDDSDGHASGVVARACDIHIAACGKLKPDPLKLARDLFRREIESEWDFFHAASETYADVLGEKGLAEYRRLASEAWQAIKPRRGGVRSVHEDDSGARRRIADILERFAEREGDLDARIAIRAKDLSSAYAYLGIAELCASHGRKAEALKWAEDGLWQFENDPDERLFVFTANLYRSAGRATDADQLLWQCFERFPSLETYSKLKAAAGTDQAVAVRDRAVALLKPPGSKAKSQARPRWGSPSELLVRLLLMEGLLTEAWKVAGAEGCSAELLEMLAEASETSHPAEALAAYAQRVEQLGHLGGNDSYGDACRLIARMRVIRERLDDAGAHAAWLADVMTRHKAKRNFMKLLRGQGESVPPSFPMQ